MFYAMHVLTITIIFTFLAEIEVWKINFGCYMGNGAMDDA
jgi:hypothetical protein